MAQGVQGPLDGNAGQLGGLAQLLADVLAVHRLVQRSELERLEALFAPFYYL